MAWKLQRLGLFLSFPLILGCSSTWIGGPGALELSPPNLQSVECRIPKNGFISIARPDEPFEVPVSVWNKISTQIGRFDSPVYDPDIETFSRPIFAEVTLYGKDGRKEALHLRFGDDQQLVVEKDGWTYQPIGHQKRKRVVCDMSIRVATILARHQDGITTIEKEKLETDFDLIQRQVEAWK